MSTTIIDGFEGYFSEKIWAMIPDIYRFKDGIAANPGVLRALVELLAAEATHLRRSQDRLWEDIFIETSDEWAVPYIGGLVATRLLSALNPRGRRIDVAKTIYYRRRKGTPRVLEELIYDISEWDGKMVESFTRLGRARHGLDPKPAELKGFLTNTSPGGWADLREQQGSELAGGPFDEYFHTPDFRFANGQLGIYNIPKLAFHLFRMVSYPVKDCTPFSVTGGLRFLFDPSGRDIPLYKKRIRPDDWDQWHSAKEWEIQGPIRCRLLGQSIYQVTESVIAKLSILPLPGLSAAGAADLRRIIDLEFRDEDSLRVQLASFTTHTELLGTQIIIPILKYSLINECGKSRLMPDALALELGGTSADTGSLAVSESGVTLPIFTAEHCVSAFLEKWTVNVSDKQLAMDAERGRFLFLGPAVNPLSISASYYYGFPGPIGAGTYSRPNISVMVPTVSKTGGGVIVTADLPFNGLMVIKDSKTYGPVTDGPGIQSRILQAADLQRPYIWLNSDWIMDTGANKGSKLILDGLWIGASGNTKRVIELAGDYDTIVIKNSTLDPGGSQNIKLEPIYPLQLIIKGTVSKLCILDSITGPISVDPNGELEKLFICNSIIQSIDSAIMAINCFLTNVELVNSTVFGKIKADRLNASEVIITDQVDITDNQDGCFRFSTAPFTSRLPRPYASFLFTTDTSNWFLSRVFGKPEFASLSEAAPVQVQRGGENDTEMGAFHSLNNPVKQDGLWNKIQEYMPFGLIPVFINET